MFGYKYRSVKFMKRVLSIALVFILIATLLCGCSSAPNADMTEKNVRKTVDVAFEALKDFDIETLDTYVKSSTLTQIITFAEEHDQFKALGRAIFANLSYEIKEIDLDAALVTITVNNKDLEEAAKKFMDGLLGDFSLMELLSQLNDDSWLDSNLSILTSSIDKCEMNPEPTEITLKIREGAENLVLRFGTDAENAVSGGALGAIKSIIPF